MLITSMFYKKPGENVYVIPLYEFKPKEYKIYEVKVNEGTLDLKIEIPVSTELKVKILDNGDNEIQKLIDEKNFPRGIYNIKCRLDNNSAGKYKCNMETKDFIYETDFFIY